VNKGDATEVTAADFIGDHEQRSGLAGLEAIEEISVVAAPDLMGLPHLDADSVRAVQFGLLAHAELMGRIAILDTPGGLSVRQVREWRETMRYDSAYAALYYPWIRVQDGPMVPGTSFIPPSGHLAGVHARSDVDHHVANEPIQGALWLELDLLLQEQEVLHPMGINALLAQPGRGALVWGARTLSSDPTWRYLRTRRLMNFIARNIRAGTNWVIFEKSHDEKLWHRIREELEDLFAILWRTGALGGGEPEEAYSVKCDRENNPPEVVDARTIVADCALALHEGGTGQLDFRVTYFLG
jgi:Bacteriophage tail sheath protein